MKLQLLHGPAINNSRSKLLEIKSKFPGNVVVFDSTENSGTLLANLMTPSLLPEEQLIILENPPEDFVLNFPLYPIPYTLILWFDHEVSEKKPVFKNVLENKGEILFFPESKEVSVFPLLDYLGNKERDAYLELEKLKKGGSDTQYIIIMIFYLLRSLIAPNKNAPEFVKQKLARQKMNFSDEDLKNLYKFVLETDFKIKSGLIETPHAEFLIISRFVDLSK